MHIVEHIKNLCKEGKYNEAIELTKQIENKPIALKLHLLIIEAEQANFHLN